MKRTSTHRSSARFIARVLPGSQPATYPGFIDPCLATIRKDVPRDGSWLYEIKFDGYRVQAHFAEGQAKIFTRRGNDWTDRFKLIAAALVDLPANTIILDGEVIVPDERGISRFERLQADLGSGRSDNLYFYAFDLLYLDGFDIRRAPLIERKRVLAVLLAGAGSKRILYSSHVDADGAAMFTQACAIGLEGIICKQPNVSYRSGRSDSWLKVKCSRQEVLPIIGFKPEPGRVASIYLGRWQGKELVYAGKAGTGFTTWSATELRERLDQLVIDHQPLTKKIRMKGTWVRPELEAEIEYREITEDGLLRQSVYKGLRATRRR